MRLRRAERGERHLAGVTLSTLTGSAGPQVGGSAGGRAVWAWRKVGRMLTELMGFIELDPAERDVEMSTREEEAANGMGGERSHEDLVTGL